MMYVMFLFCDSFIKNTIGRLLSETVTQVRLVLDPTESVFVKDGESPHTAHETKIGCVTLCLILYLSRNGRKTLLI